MKFTEPKTLFLLPSFACVSKTPAAAIPASPHKLWCPQNQSSRKSGGQSPEHSRLGVRKEASCMWHTLNNAALTEPALALPPARPLTMEGLFLTPGCSRTFWHLSIESHCVCQKPSTCCWVIFRLCLFLNNDYGFFFLSTCYILCILKLCVCINFVMSEGL